MESNEREIEKFQKAISSIKNEYCGISAHVISLRWDSYNLNIASRFALVSDRKNSSRGSYLRQLIKGLWVYKESLPIDELERILSIFRTGEYECHRITVQYKKWENKKLAEPHYVRFGRYTREDSYRDFGINSLCNVLHAEETVVNNTIGYEGYKGLEAKLSSLKKPFSDIPDLIYNYLGPHTFKDPYSSSTIQIIAPVRIRFSAYNLSRDSIVLETEMHTAHNHKKASIGLIARISDKALFRKKLPIQKKVIKSRDFQIFTNTIKIPESADNIIGMLSYGKCDEVDRIVVNRIFTAGVNPRMKILSNIDPDLKGYNQGLIGQGAGSGRGLEQAVNNLFTFLGFSSIHIGGESREVPDVILFWPDPTHCLIIECSSDSPDLRNKLTKFASRIKYYQNNTQECSIHGIMVTSLEGDAINPAEIERAKSDHILLLTSEDLRQLNGMARRGDTFKDVIKYLNEVEMKQMPVFR